MTGQIAACGENVDMWMQMRASQTGGECVSVVDGAACVDPAVMDQRQWIESLRRRGTRGTTRWSREECH